MAHFALSRMIRDQGAGGRRWPLWTSLGLIGLKWAYEAIAPDRGLPSELRELVLRFVLEKAAVLLAIWVLLKWEGDGLAQLGVVRLKWPNRIGTGVLFGVAMFIVINVGLTSLLNSLVPAEPASGRSAADFLADSRNVPAFMAMGVFGGGVVEELERIFIITRFEKWLSRPGLILGVILSSVMFGMGHRYQGLGSAMSTAFSGAALALLFLRRRSAWEPIAAHASGNVLAIIAALLLARH